MTKLSPELCQWLKEKGFPQELEVGDKFTIDSALRIPTLEPLLEWARKVLYKDGTPWSFIDMEIRDDVYMIFFKRWSEDVRLLVSDDSEQIYEGTDPDPKVAIVKLLQEVL